MAEPNELSLDEILAACRRMDGGGDAESAPPPAEDSFFHVLSCTVGFALVPHGGE